MPCPKNRVHISSGFAAFLQRNPCIIRKFARAYHSNAERMDFGEVIVEKVHGRGWNHTATWKVSAPEETLFVKEIGLEDTCMWQRGHGLFRTLERLATLETEHVKVVPRYLGILTAKTSFFVAPYSELPILEDVKDSVPAEILAEFDGVRQAAKKSGFWDIKYENCKYDASLKQIFVCDAMGGI